VARVAQRRERRFPKPERVGSNPAVGAHRRGCPSVGSTDGGCGTLITCWSRVRFPPGVPHFTTAGLAQQEERLSCKQAARVRVLHPAPCSTAFGRQRRGGEAVLKTVPGLHRPEGSIPLPSAATCSASVAQRREQRVSTSPGAGSNPAGGSITFSRRRRLGAPGLDACPHAWLPRGRPESCAPAR
jgi:hypothetical protein